MKWLKDSQLVPLFRFIKNGLLAPVDIARNLISVTKLKRTLVKYLGWTLLYMGKPFSSIGNWFWKLHRTVLDWNK